MLQIIIKSTFPPPSQAPKPGSPDRTPPSRVSDLAVAPLDPSDPSSGLLATWTAPGDDFADGAVAGYKFVYSEDTGDLLDVDRSKPGKNGLLKKILEQQSTIVFAI